MVTMAKRGQAVSRKGDAESLATYEAAYNFYRAEAMRRGLVGQEDNG
jgi:hypothetical protein